MRPPMRNRLRCLLRGHDWPHWPTWTHAGHAKHYRQRWCQRCGTEQLETDGA